LNKRANKKVISFHLFYIFEVIQCLYSRLIQLVN
jgi:hypothetical protein